MLLRRTSDDQGNTKRLGCGRPEHYQPWERNPSDRFGFLYQQVRTTGTTGIYAGRGQDGFQRLQYPISNIQSHPSRPGLARIPIADYLARLHPDQVGLFVWDEAHNAKGQATDAGHALATIAQVADHVLLMTGTLFGGAASSVFFLAHRISPEFRRRWRFDQLQAFVERYGVLERKIVEKEVEVESRGTLSTKTRKNTYVKELPGCSPALVSLFLGFTIFTGLSDLGISLPPVKRRIVNAELDPDHTAAYAAYEDACRDVMDEMKEQDVDLAGSFLHTLRGYTVAPWRPEYLKWKVRQPVNGRLRHTEMRIFNVAPSLQWQCATCGRTFQHPGPLDDPQRLRCDWCYPATTAGDQAWQDALTQHAIRITLASSPPNAPCSTKSSPKKPAAVAASSLSAKLIPATSCPVCSICAHSTPSKPAELISRVMNRAQGQTDDGSSELVEDLETLFARYTELEESGDVALTDNGTGPQVERVRQMAVEFRSHPEHRPELVEGVVEGHRAVEAADWAASQLVLF